MKKRLLFLAVAFGLFVAANSQAANVNVGVNVNIGAPAIAISSPPEFLLIPALGVHISIGAPYDLFYLDGYYYQNSKNRWYRSNNYRGPWGYVEPRHLPQRMNKHAYREMLNWRDRDYQEYKKDRQKHRDRYFRAEEKHERKEDRREDRRDEHQGGHGHKGK